MEVETGGLLGLVGFQPGQENFSLWFRERPRLKEMHGEWRGGRSLPSSSSQLAYAQMCVCAEGLTHHTFTNTDGPANFKCCLFVCLFVYVPVGTGHRAKVETMGHMTWSGFSPPPCGSQELSLGSLYLSSKHLHASPNFRIIVYRGTKSKG